MLSSIELRILRSANGDTWQDEIVVLVNDIDVLATLGRSRWSAWMGLDPARSKGPGGHVEFPPGRIFGSADEGDPADRFVARCDCGELGCGALVANVRQSGARVVWDRFRSGSDASSRWRPVDVEPLEFENAQYREALMEPSTDGLWQPTTRRAAALAQGRAADADVSSLRLRAVGFWARGDAEVVGKVTLGRKGDSDWSFLTFGTRLQPGESEDDLADRAVSRVTTGAVLTDGNVDRRPLGRPHAS